MPPRQTGQVAEWARAHSASAPGGGPKTRKRYDRTSDQFTLDQVERNMIRPPRPTAVTISRRDAYSELIRRYYLAAGSCREIAEDLRIHRCLDKPHRSVAKQKVTSPGMQAPVVIDHRRC